MIQLFLSRNMGNYIIPKDGELNMLSIRTGYAILALACMTSDKQDWYKVEDISNRGDIPKSYLHKILHALGKSGLVNTKRGPQGGMALSRPADQITLLDIVEAVQGEEWMHCCLLGLAECSDERSCPVHEFWKGEIENIKDRMKQTTLDQVAEFEGKEGGRLKSIEEIQKYLNKRKKKKRS